MVNDMKEYIVLFLLLLVLLHGFKFLKHGFTISNPDLFLKKLQDKIDHINKTKSNKGLLGAAILVCWFWGALIISLSIYAISTIVKIG